MEEKETKVNDVEMQEKPEKTYLIYGELTYDEKVGNIPILEIRTRVGKDGPEETFGYMTPFRGYFFQISKTREGQFDLASHRSGANTMSNLFRDCSREQKREIYRTMMFSTFLHCLSNNYGKDLHPSHSLMTEYNEDSPIGEFIEKSIDWVERYCK